MSGQTCRATLDIQYFMQQHSASVRMLSSKMRDHDSSHSVELQMIQRATASINERLEVLAAGLCNVSDGGEDDANQEDARHSSFFSSAA